MFCYNERNGSFQAFETIYGRDFFGDCPRISLVGAGGKTTTLFRLRDMFRRMDRPVVMTTTTKMYREKEPWCVVPGDARECERAIRLYGQVLTGSSFIPATNNVTNDAGFLHTDERTEPPLTRQKLCAAPERTFRALEGMGYPMIIEADGAKGCLIKAPGDHEPAVPPCTTHLLAVYGLAALGKPVADVGFRVGLILDVIKKNAADAVRESDIADLAVSDRGGRKGANPDMRFGVILNQADSPLLIRSALDIKRQIQQRVKCDVWITGRGIK